jgi:hypothetical protein
MRTFVLVSIIFFARIASAQVLISEIMYAPEGVDAKHEGVELTNNGTEGVDLTGWKFDDGATAKHGLNLPPKNGGQGALVIPVGAHVILADDATIFFSDHTGYQGTVIDTVLDLGNTNDTIAIIDNNGTVIDTVAYDSSLGAKDDGTSLQKIDGVWQASTPTPGTGVSPVQPASDVPAGSQDAQGTSPNNEAVSTTATKNVSYFPVEPQIFTKITAQTQTVSVGAAMTFEGRVWGLKKEPIENARMVWAFGDGATSEGSSVLHTYYYPGEYSVILDASSGYYAASDRVRVVAVAPMLALHTGGDETRSFVAIENRGNDELDLSGWQVEAFGKTFIIPKNTLVSAHKILTLASEVTGLTTPAGSVASLHFPNGTQVSLQGELTATISAPSKEIIYTKPSVHSVETKNPPPENEEASVIGATQGLLPENPKTDLWVWYVGVAFFAALALLGLRFVRKTSTPGLLTADDFDIIDEDEDKKDDLF